MSFLDAQQRDTPGARLSCCDAATLSRADQPRAPTADVGRHGSELSYQNSPRSVRADAPGDAHSPPHGTPTTKRVAVPLVQLRVKVEQVEGLTTGSTVRGSTRLGGWPFEGGHAAATARRGCAECTPMTTRRHSASAPECTPVLDPEKQVIVPPALLHVLAPAGTPTHPIASLGN